jgi:hypothetical protein
MAPDLSPARSIKAVREVRDGPRTSPHPHPILSRPQLRPVFVSPQPSAHTSLHARQILLRFQWSVREVRECPLIRKDTQENRYIPKRGQGREGESNKCPQESKSADLRERADLAAVFRPRNFPSRPLRFCAPRARAEASVSQMRKENKTDDRLPGMPLPDDLGKAANSVRPPDPARPDPRSGEIADAALPEMRHPHPRPTLTTWEPAKRASSSRLETEVHGPAVGFRRNPQMKGETP